MATETTNLHLTKPAASDNVDIADFNSNADKIDAAYANIVQQLNNKLTEADIATLRATVAAQGATLEDDTAALIELVDAGAKNLLNPESAVGYVGQSGYPISKSGVTYTLDANSETITLSDTATSVSTLRIPITLSPGTYHVSGIPSGGSDSSYRADLREAGGNTFITSDFDYGSGITFTLSATTSMDYCIRVANGYSPQNVVVSPMICTEKAWSVSQQFVKYRPSYDELITRIEALEQANGISANVVSQSRGTRTIEDI